jgi:hypothetical protein
MTKLIDKSALVAEIEKRIEETESMQPKFDQFWAGQISAFKGVLKILDTLEVKEVNFEKELISWHKKHFKKEGTFEKYGGFYFANSSQLDLAKHFFELGLKAKIGG